MRSKSNKRQTLPPPAFIEIRNVWDELVTVPNPAYEDYRHTQANRGRAANRSQSRHNASGNHTRRRRILQVAGVIGAIAGLSAAVVAGVDAAGRQSTGPSENATRRHSASAPARPSEEPNIASQQHAANQNPPNNAESTHENTQIPAAVLAASKSVVTIQASNRAVPGKSGNELLKGGVSGTGIVVELNGVRKVLTAAHVAKKDPEIHSKPNPNYTNVEANVGGELREMPIISEQVPPNFNAAGDNYDSGGNIDLADLGVSRKVYFNSHEIVDGKNGFDTIPALQIAPTRPPVGSKVYALVMGNPYPTKSDEINVPPTPPTILTEEIVGYDGAEVDLKPVQNDSDPGAYAGFVQGDSGGALLDANGRVFANIVASNRGVQLNPHNINVLTNSPDQPAHDPLFINP